MKEQTFKYVIHLHDGDIVTIQGIPCRVMGDWEVMTNTNPELLSKKVDFDEVPMDDLENKLI